MLATGLSTVARFVRENPAVAPAGGGAASGASVGRGGPLAGVLTAMRHTAATTPEATHVVAVPTDTPFFPDDLVARLAGALTERQQIAVAASAGQMHPLFALWPVALADDLENWLTNDPKRRVRAFIERHASATVDFPVMMTSKGAFDPFFNINTPEDLAEAQEWVSFFEDSKT